MKHIGVKSDSFIADGAPVRVTAARELRAEFGANGSGALEWDMLGDRYVELANEIAAIIEYQWVKGTDAGLAGLPGFALNGPPGVGKTTLVRRVTLELSRRLGSGDQVALAFVDASDIARSKYGESERVIRDVFLYAQAEFARHGTRFVVLFDDVDSVFANRSNQEAKEWHFSQDNVFYHVIDALDTRSTAVVLTTNRPDLVDDAIRDRFLEYNLGLPSASLLSEAARRLGRRYGLSDDEANSLAETVSAGDDEVTSGSVRSFRQVQQLVLQAHVARIVAGAGLRREEAR